MCCGGMYYILTGEFVFEAANSWVRLSFAKIFQVANHSSTNATALPRHGRPFAARTPNMEIVPALSWPAIMQREPRFWN